MQAVYGISLGPGDPELLSLKALRLLKEADLVFYPGSEAAGQERSSFVLPMLQYHGIEPQKLQGFFLNMSSDRAGAEQTYRSTAALVEQASGQGKKVCIVCEGDLSFYASFSYLLKHLQQMHLPVELVPGINSFSLAAARHQVPVSLQGEKVAVLPLEASIDKLTDALAVFDTVILMKIRSGWQQLQPHLRQRRWRFYYAEYLGTDREYITTDIALLKDRDIPYFSLLIIKK